MKLELLDAYSIRARLSASIILHAADAVAAGSFGGVDFRSSDDLAVGSLQIKLNAGRDSADNKFAHNSFPFLYLTVFL